MSEHEAPLRLKTGGDRSLFAMTLGACLLGGLAISLASAEALVRLAALALLLAAVLSLARPSRPVLFIIFPGGRCRVGDREMRLLPQAWLTRYYCVLTGVAGRRRHRFLISASRQAPGEYRKLCTWIRLQRVGQSGHPI